MRRDRLCLFFAIFVLAVPAALRAQTGIHLNFTGATLSEPNEPNVYGTTFGIYSQTTRFGLLGIGGAGRGFVLTGDGGNETFMGGGVGPRLAIRPRVLPISPYGEVLFGVAHAEFGQGGAHTVHTSAMYQVLVGVDYTLISHLDWRVIEFTYGQQQGTGIGYKAVSTGIVIRFP